MALNAYWKSIGGEVMLPGTNRAADRLVRASYYVNIIPRNADNQRTVASVLSVIRNASVPLGISTPDQPNISSTLWRTVSDQENRVYYFESTSTPNTFWVDLKAQRGHGNEQADADRWLDPCRRGFQPVLAGRAIQDTLNGFGWSI